MLFDNYIEWKDGNPNKSLRCFIHESREEGMDIGVALAEELFYACSAIGKLNEVIEGIEDDLDILIHHLCVDTKNKGCCMDKQIKKVQKDVGKAEKNLKKGDKDTKTLLKMDKAFDKKIAKCAKSMKAKKK